MRARLGDGTVLVDREAQPLQDDAAAYEACERILELLLDSADELQLTDIGVWGQHVLLISDAFGVRNMEAGGVIKAVGTATVQAAYNGGDPARTLVSGLAAGKAHDVFFVTETTDSNGVFGELSKRLTVTTHRSAPRLSRLSAIAAPGTSDAITLSFRLSAAAAESKRAFSASKASIASESSLRTA